MIFISLSSLTYDPSQQIAEERALPEDSCVLPSEISLLWATFISWKDVLGGPLGLQLIWPVWGCQPPPCSCQQVRDVLPQAQTITFASGYNWRLCKDKDRPLGTTSFFQPKKGKINTWNPTSSTWGNCCHSAFYAELTANFSIKSQIVNILDLRTTQNLFITSFPHTFMQYLKMQNPLSWWSMQKQAME